MTKKYLESLNELARLPKLIVRKHPMGYVGANVRGARGAGKTAFCMHTGRQVYQYIDGITRDDAWEKLLGVGNYRKEKAKILFSMSDVIDSLEILDNIDFKNILEWQKDNTIPCYIWDDAGMHGGRYKFFTDVKTVEHLQGLTDTIRFVVTGFLINSPEISGLLSFLREYKDQKVISINHRAEGDTKYGRRASIKGYKEDRRGRFILAREGSTDFSCYVDKWAYSEYSRMKAKAIIENIHKIKQLVKTEKKSKPDKKENEIAESIGLPDNYLSLIQSD